jgi:flagellar assembly factor FliW
MLSAETRYFGILPYENDSIIEFPEGLPGFENERRFLPLELAAHRPLVFLQSLATPGLCFPALPVAAIDEHYRLRLEAADLAALGLPAGARPAMGRDVLCTPS